MHGLLVMDANQTPKPVAQHPNSILLGVAQLQILCSSINFPTARISLRVI
jgi:hypothetical protein